MKRLTFAIAALAAVSFLAACDSRWGTENPQPLMTGLPSVPHPVGPVPGPAKATKVDNPLANDPQATMNGRTLFVRFNCAGCHGGRGGGGMGPSLRDQSWIYGSGDGDIFDSIAEGRAHGMPAWGTKLQQQQIWELVAYIRSMGTDHEPEAPR